MFILHCKVTRYLFFNTICLHQFLPSTPPPLNLLATQCVQLTATLVVIRKCPSSVESTSGCWLRRSSLWTRSRRSGWYVTPTGWLISSSLASQEHVFSGSRLGISSCPWPLEWAQSCLLSRIRRSTWKLLQASQTTAEDQLVDTIWPSKLSSAVEMTRLALQGGQQNKARRPAPPVPPRALGQSPGMLSFLKFSLNPSISANIFNSIDCWVSSVVLLFWKCLPV